MRGGGWGGGGGDETKRIARTKRAKREHGNLRGGVCEGDLV
jgi:hypothetical protein